MSEEKLNPQSPSYKFSNWIVQNSWKSIALFMVVMAVMIPGILKIRASYTPKVWFDPDHPNIQKLNTFEQRFGNDQNIVIGVHHPQGIFQQDVLNEIARLTEGMWKVTDVIRVESLSNYNYIEAIDDDIIIEPFLPDQTEFSNEELVTIKNKAMSDDVIPEFFISPDATYALIYGYMRPYFSDEPDFSKVVDDVRSLIAGGAPVKGLEIYMLGDAAANDAFREISKKDNEKLIPFMIFFVVFLLFLAFRSFTALALPLLLTATTVLVCFGAMGHLHILMSSLLSAIPGVMLAICMADSVHILNIFFHERQDGHHSKEAILRSLVINFQPTILTSLSTAISFFSITLTDIAPVRDLGILAGIGTIVAWFFTYMLVGAILSLMSNFLERYPTKVIHFENLFSKMKGRESEGIMAEKAVNIIDDHKGKIILLFVLATIASIFISLKNEVNSDPVKYFHETVPVRQAYDFSTTKLDGLKGIELVADSGVDEGVKDPKFLRKLDAYMTWLKSDPEITKVKSVMEIIKKMNKILHGNKEEFYTIPDQQKSVAEILFLYTVGLPQGMDLNNQITLDNRRLRMRVIWALETSKEISLKAKYLVKKAKDFGLNIQVDGNVPIYMEINDIVVISFFKSMGMALLLVGLLLLVVFKDFYISFLSMLPNIIPLTFGGAVMALMGKYIDIGSSMVYTVCLGIAVDDTIHFVAHYKIDRKNGLTPHQAIEKIFKSTGKALVITTVLLVAGFGSFIFAEFEPNRNFGIFCAFILSMALITDLIFLPALLLFADKRK